MADYDPDRLMTERPTGTPMMTVRPRKLTREDAEKLVRKYNPDITRAAVKGEVDNIMRESGGNSANDTGDHGTSGGMYQHHNERLTGLKKFAAEQKADWRDPDIQVRYARLEKERDYPGLLRLQQSTDDPVRAEDAFKRIFERPASTMWQHNPDGSPVLGNDRYRFSDYAINEGRRLGDLHFMSPGEYLDLSPELGGKPFESPSGRSLMRSFNRGDPIEAVPTLDVNVNGPTATVTDQDGRHRALLAQQEGIDTIPVAIRQSGQGQPTEIQGMSGTLMAHDFPKAEGYQKPAPAPRQEQPEQPREPISLLERVGTAINPIGRAEAAEPNPFAQWAPPTKTSQSDNPFAQWAPKPAAQPSGGIGDLVSGIGGTLKAAGQGAVSGFGEPVFGGQELAGKALEAAGAPQAGAALTADARQRLEAEKAGLAGPRAEHPTATTIGETAGGAVLPGLIGARMGGGVGGNALAGGLAGLLQPTGDQDFWRNKMIQASIGASTGIVGGKIGNALGKLATPAFRAATKLLMDEGIELTPGMMTGGIVKSLEDRATSIPITGDAIQAARRRAFEQFNRAAWNRALDPIGQTIPANVPMGRAAADYVGDQLTAAYGRILPHVTVTANLRDPAFQRFVGDMGTAVNDARVLLPDAEFNQFERFVRSQIEQKIGHAGGMIGGDVVNGIDSMFGSEIRGYLKSGEHDKRKLGEALRDVQIAFRQLLEDQNPGQAPALRKVREGYANFVRVAKAGAAVGTATKEGIFSPAQLNAAVRSEDNTTRKLGYSRGQALLQDLSDAGQAILPSQYPDSGTAGRLMLGAGTFGAAELLHHPEIMLGLLASAAPYTAPASKALNWAANKLAQQPGQARAMIGNALQAIGRLGAPALGGAGGGAAPGVVNALPSMVPSMMPQQSPQQ